MIMIMMMMMMMMIVMMMILLMMIDDDDDVDGGGDDCKRYDMICLISSIFNNVDDTTGCKSAKACTIILRGASSHLLGRMTIHHMTIPYDYTI